LFILPPLKDADHPKRTARRARKRATTVPRRRSSRPSSTILSATAGSRSTLSSTATRARMYFDSSRSCVTDDRELGQAAVPTYFISRDQTFEAMRGDAVTCSACRKACERRLRAHTRRPLRSTAYRPASGMAWTQPQRGGALAPAPLRDLREYVCERVAATAASPKRAMPKGVHRGRSRKHPIIG